MWIETDVHNMHFYFRLQKHENCSVFLEKSKFKVQLVNTHIKLRITQYYGDLDLTLQPKRLILKSCFISSDPNLNFY